MSTRLAAALAVGGIILTVALMGMDARVERLTERVLRAEAAAEFCGCPKVD